MTTILDPHAPLRTAGMLAGGDGAARAHGARAACCSARVASAPHAHGCTHTYTRATTADATTDGTRSNEARAAQRKPAPGLRGACKYPVDTEARGNGGLYSVPREHARAVPQMDLPLHARKGPRGVRQRSEHACVGRSVRVVREGPAVDTE